VLKRLAAIMFVDAARRDLECLPEDATSWLAGLRDRFVGKALELMHERPDHAWTVDDLAREVGLSRSALHERFVQDLGHPPMRYLASWRIQLGARLLRESNRSVATIVVDVDHEPEAVLSRAFRRLVGMPAAASAAPRVGNGWVRFPRTRLGQNTGNGPSQQWKHMTHRE
jgi:transcriptional regulator GlxA family with amidase domain